MKYILKSPVHILLFLWLPVSCGNFLFAGSSPGALSPQIMIILAFYAFSLVILIYQNRILKINIALVLLVTYTLLTGAILNFSNIHFWLKIFSFGGVILLATAITRNCDFEDFIQICYRSLLATFTLSILFSVAFPSLAFSNSEYGLALNSFYEQKNTFGRLVYFLCLFYLLAKPKTHHPIKTTSTLIIFFIALFLSESRTSIAIAGIIVALFYTLQYSQTLRRLFRPSIVILSLAITIPVIFLIAEIGGIGDNFDYISVAGVEIALTGRATIWSNVLNALTTEEKWLFGFGLEGFYGTGYSHYVTSIGLGNFIPNDSHNGYIDLLLNLGISGCVIYVIIFITLIRNTARIYNKLAQIGMIVFLVIYILTNFTESFLVKTSNITSFLFICMYLYSGKLGTTHASQSFTDNIS